MISKFLAVIAISGTLLFTVNSQAAYSNEIKIDVKVTVKTYSDQIWYYENFLPRVAEDTCLAQGFSGGSVGPVISETTIGPNGQGEVQYIDYFIAQCY